MIYFKNGLNKLLFIFFLFFLLISIYSIIKIFLNNTENVVYYYLYLIISLVNLFFLSIVFLLPNKIKILYLITFSFFIITLYSIEIYLIYKPITIWEEYERVTKQGIEIIPHYRKRYFKTTNIENPSSKEIYTLGGVSNVGLVLTNENGYYPLVKHDEYGWNNPNNIYQNYEAVMLGDSFVEGYAVNQENNIPSILTRLGIKTINFGLAANSPLHMYAVFKEYVEFYKPKKILWVYTDFDLWELQKDLNDKFLLNYLDNEFFTQNLIYRQNEIDQVMSQYAINNWEKEKLARVRKYINHYQNRNIYFRTIKLTELRERLKLYDKKYINKIQQLKKEASLNKKYELKDETFKVYEKIFFNILKKTKKWNGELIFIYIPSKSKYLEKEDIKKNSLYVESIDKIYKEISKIVDDYNVQIIDLNTIIKSNFENPMDIYSSHFNIKGYKFISNQIYKEIK